MMVIMSVAFFTSFSNNKPNCVPMECLGCHGMRFADKCNGRRQECASPLLFGFFFVPPIYRTCQKSGGGDGQGICWDVHR